MKKPSTIMLVLTKMLLLCIFVIPATGAGAIERGEAPAPSAIQQNVYRRLDSIRETKKNQLLHYMASIRSHALSIGQDQMMLAYFHLKNKFHQIKKQIVPSESLVERIEVLKKKIRIHYLQHYLSFYDILFINHDGDIFSSIRHQKDYGQNIFKGELATTSIARQLKETPDKQFVDYQYYAISDEPSAFFVIPVYQGEIHRGWFALQCAINRINGMFSREEGLGRTGEVFLVNRQQYMLTESRFTRDSSILRQHLSERNIDLKFELGLGNREVIDYRGRKALSSFEVCRIENHEWLLIAKIDEDEIVTNCYLKDRENLRPKLLARLLKGSPAQNNTVPIRTGRRIEVDMDEYRKGTSRELISTSGISTCTAMLVSYPGRFAYTAHISNLDKMYAGQVTNLVRQIFKRIDRFEICNNDKRNLNILLVAPHGETILRAIDLLLEEGIFLSQIRFLCNRDADYANMIHDCIENKTMVEWVLDRKTGFSQQQLARKQPTIGELVKQLAGYR